VGIGRKAFKIWLTTSIVWIIVIVAAFYAGGVFPTGYQANFPLRTLIGLIASQFAISCIAARMNSCCGVTGDGVTSRDGVT
jgi:hypothetical protein